jgi:hypothetical protein
MLLLIGIFLAQIVIYGLLIWILARILGRYRSFSRISIFCSCLVVGLLSGLLTAWLWPRFDSVTFPNTGASILGDQIYIWATGTVPPGTPSPHNAIAWPLRIPQVYIFASVLLFGVVGLGIQAIYNKYQP